MKLKTVQLTLSPLSWHFFPMSETHFSHEEFMDKSTPITGKSYEFEFLFLSLYMRWEVVK